MRAELVAFHRQRGNVTFDTYENEPEVDTLQRFILSLFHQGHRQ